jgi:hypothetical protein
MTTARAFRGFRFPAEVILWAVRWYLQFPISYRDLERMLADRGVEVDHTTMYRWAQRFAPELEKRMRRQPCARAKRSDGASAVRNGKAQTRPAQGIGASSTSEIQRRPLALTKWPRLERTGSR